MLGKLLSKLALIVSRENKLRSSGGVMFYNTRDSKASVGVLSLLYEAGA